jgi:hypothetical protein
MSEANSMDCRVGLPILVSYQSTWIAAAVPKRRGSGYLKVPAGHHPAKWINEAEDAAGGADISGLDGWLEIELPHRSNDREKFAAMLPVLLREFKASCAIETTLAAVLEAHRQPNTTIQRPSGPLE